MVDFLREKRYTIKFPDKIILVSNRSPVTKKQLLGYTPYNINRYDEIVFILSFNKYW